MVIDSSAIFAIVLNEPERQPFLLHISRAEIAFISAATLLECKIVALRKMGADWEGELVAVLERLPLAVIPFDVVQAQLAAAAFRAFGKGRHPAALNIGDCISYVLAKHLGEPLLFKGGDFAHTDIVSALS
jgi:ribonuclease VapC